jgi:hypothetical protein
MPRPACCVQQQIRLRPESFRGYGATSPPPPESLGRKEQRKESFYHKEHIAHKDRPQKKQFFFVVSVFFVIEKTGGFWVLVKNTYLTTSPPTPVFTNVCKGFVFYKKCPSWAVQKLLFMP